MNRIQITTLLTIVSTVGLFPTANVRAQNYNGTADGNATYDTPMTRLRPIGAPSAVDQYRNSGAAYRETAYQPSVYQTANSPSEVRQAQFEVPPLPNESQTFTPPPVTRNPVTPRGLPTNPGSVLPPVGGVPINSSILSPAPLNPAVPSSDLAPLAQPQLGGSFATIDNCSCISAPSNYSASSIDAAGGCCVPANYQTSQACTAPQVYAGPPASIAPPTQIAAPAILPGGFAAPAGTAAPAGALVTFGQQRNTVEVGQGLFGQPKAYVPGQAIRNWLRYFTP